MNPTPLETLDTLLGYLGFAFRVEEQNGDGTVVLQVYTSDAEILIGHRGQTLDDLQYLVNRLIQSHDPQAPRVIVDVEHHRAMRDDAFVATIRHAAEAVRNSGRSIQTEPLNSYDRRLVHNAFKDDPDVMTWSPPDDARVKRISIKSRR
ncbi:MAG: protein jag [Pirellula staleyi]